MHVVHLATWTKTPAGTFTILAATVEISLKRELDLAHAVDEFEFDTVKLGTKRLVLFEA